MRVPSEDDPMISREQAGAAAAFLRTICPRWDQLRTLETLLELSHHHALPELIAAGVRAAADPNARTPIALTFVAPEHWRTSGNAVPIGVPTCAICGRSEHRCRDAAARTGDPHAFQKATA